MVASIKAIRTKGSTAHRVTDYYLSGEGTVRYYSDSGSVNGTWLGKGAERLGLTGKAVTPKDFLNVILGRNTKGVELRNRRSRSGKSRPKRDPDRPRDDGNEIDQDPKQVRGVDLTFSVPKSVSILWALLKVHKPELAAVIEQALLDSVRDSLNYAEATVSTSRRGKRGAIQTPGELVTALFMHELPRTYVEPQLHVHAITAAVVRRDDGQWGTLNTKALFDATRSLGPYQACQFAKYLQERLGVEIEIPIDAKTGKLSTCFEIKGISRELIEQYSSRRKEIEAAVELSGNKASSAQARANANLKTRLPKDPTLTEAKIFDAWEKLSDKAGFTKEEVLALTGHAQIRESLSPKTIETCVLEVANELVVSDATFRPLDLLRETCQRLQGRATGEEVDAAIRTSLQGKHFVHVADLEKGPIYTTREHWELEKELIRSLKQISESTSARADRVEIDYAIAKRGLSEEQKQAVEYCCSSDSGGVRTVLGAAGTGKTTTLGCIAEAFKLSGKHVIGAALAGTAAKELASVGIESRTIASILFELNPERYLSFKETLEYRMEQAHAKKRPALAKNGVLIIDEASMVDAKTFLELAKECQTLGITLIVVGDLKQLTSINAAAPLSYIAAEFGSVKLEQNKRQVNLLDRLAVDLVRQGRIAEAVQSYHERGLFKVSETRKEAAEEIVKQWMEDGNSKKAEKAVVLTLTNQDAAEINMEFPTKS